MGVDTDKMRREAATWQGIQNVNGRNMLNAAADEIDALRAAIATHETSSMSRNGDSVSQDSHDMAKCPNCEKCISDLRSDKESQRGRAEKAEKERDALRADVQRLKDEAETARVWRASHEKALRRERKGYVHLSKALRAEQDETARLRSILSRDVTGSDSAEVDLLTKQLAAARRGMESAVRVAELAWGGEIPSPLPFHRSNPDDLSELDAAEMASRDIDCPFCGGSGHADDVSKAVTVMRWTRYDGTEKTCPPRGEDVLLRCKGHIWHETMRGFWCQYSGTKFRLRWYSAGDSQMEWAKPGDEWALLASGPSRPSIPSCAACSGSGVEGDGSHGGIADLTPCAACNGTGVAEFPGSVERCECGGKGA